MMIMPDLPVIMTDASAHWQLADLSRVSLPVTRPASSAVARPTASAVGRTGHSPEGSSVRAFCSGPELPGK